MVQQVIRFSVLIVLISLVGLKIFTFNHLFSCISKIGQMGCQGDSESLKTDG